MRFNDYVTLDFARWLVRKRLSILAAERPKNGLLKGQRRLTNCCISGKLWHDNLLEQQSVVVSCPTGLVAEIQAAVQYIGYFVVRKLRDFRQRGQGKGNGSKG